MQKYQTLSIDNFDRLDLKKTCPDFLYNVLPLLATHKPTLTSQGYSASKLFEVLSARELALYKFVYTMRYSSISKTPQTTRPDVCSAVPLVLLAYKQYHNIRYSAWDRTDSYFHYLLNHNLSWIGTASQLTPESFDIADDLLLSRFLTTSTTGIIEPRTTYRTARTDCEQFDRLPKYQRMMYLQTWVYSPEIVHANMIVRIDDLDYASSTNSKKLTPW